MAVKNNHYEEILNDAIDTVFEAEFPDFEIQFEEPKPSYSGLHEVDLENSTIYVSESSVNEIENLVWVWSEEIADEVLTKHFVDAVEDLENILDVKVERPFEALFDDGPGSSVAAYFFGKQRMVNGRGELKNTPFIDSKLGRNRRLGRNVKHEAGHAVQETTDIMNVLGQIVEEKTITDSEYAENLDRAGIEALTVFEDDPKGERLVNNFKLDSQILSPWDLPSLFSSKLNPKNENSPRVINGGAGYALGDHLYSNPYTMARFIAFSVKNNYKNLDVEDPIEKTRETLYETIEDAETWENIMNSIWKQNDIPEYHKLFEENYQRIQEDSVYPKNEFARLRDELLEAESPDINLYFKGRAFAHAYKCSGRSEPDNLENLEDALKVMRSKGKYHSYS